VHTVFAFLTEVEVDEEDLLEPTEIRAAMEDSFSDRYAEHYCDENNWYDLLALVLPDGTVIPLESEKDRPGRYDLAAELRASPRPWDTAIAMTVMGVASEIFEIWDWKLDPSGILLPDGTRIPIASAQTWLRERVFAEVPRLLASMYLGFNPRDNWSVHYRRKQLARQFELFVSSKFAPFSLYGDTPYCHYPAFDVRLHNQEQPGPRDAILFVDIHT
jgi:hypothetical protein